MTTTLDDTPLHDGALHITLEVETGVIAGLRWYRTPALVSVTKLDSSGPVSKITPGMVRPFRACGPVPKQREPREHHPSPWRAAQRIAAGLGGDTSSDPLGYEVTVNGASAWTLAWGLTSPGVQSRVGDLIPVEVSMCYDRHGAGIGHWLAHHESGPEAIDFTVCAETKEIAWQRMVMAFQHTPRTQA